MKFTPLNIPGAYVIEQEPRPDERGFFARAWCRRELEEHGLQADVMQINEAWNPHPGTLRGMHYQESPWDEVKLVRCLSGAMWDVLVDLRPSSPTFGKWLAEELHGRDGRMLYVPAGCAHGYQTLEPETRMVYFTSQFYAPQAARGVRFDDPQLAIAWPLPVSVVSEQDRSWPLMHTISQS